MMMFGNRRYFGELLAELGEQHLGIPRPPGSESVFDRLQAAYEAELEKVDEDKSHGLFASA